MFWRGDDPAGSPFAGALGGEGRYHESGLVIVGDTSEYVTQSMGNVKAVFGDKVVYLKDREAIKEACGTGGGTGKSGYVNYASGWADAEAGMRFLRGRVEGGGNVEVLVGEVESLVYGGGERVGGVRLKDGRVLRAELTILAAGAWTPGLVDLEGRAVATGQVMAYIEVSEEEEARYKDMPVILNFTSGLFVLPPCNGILKVARHALGYLNTTSIPGRSTPVSIPKTSYSHPGLRIPLEGEQDLRRGLREMVPEFGDRPFVKTRICWYTDTPAGDFIVAYHPTHKGLFLATGGSGHGYKFLPVLGEQVVDIIEDVPGARFKQKWAWREGVDGGVVTSDGSRGGVMQLELEEELEKGLEVH